MAQVQAYRYPPQVRRAPKATSIDEWLHVLATGLNAQKENPAYQLRKRLLREAEGKAGSREPQFVRFALMIKPWNLPL